MSGRFLRRLLLVGLFALAAVSARFAVASAASIDSMLNGTLTPSQAPALLGPITAAGRAGWNCKPEHAAAAAAWRDADLPSAGR